MTQKTQSFFEKNAVMIKVALIAFLILILLIPMSMIMSLVTERKNRQQEATSEISSKWGFEQRITGPILVIPYKTIEYKKEKDRDKEKVLEEVTHHSAYFLPEKLDITGKINPEVRYRGIFQVAVYNSILNFKGHFKTPVIDEGDKKIVIDWKGAYITIGISDLRGIKENIQFLWNTQLINCEPGVKIRNMVESGVTLRNLFSDAPTAGEYHFSFDMMLNGSKGISFVPVGKETTTTLSSSWVNPSFDGSFLPESREISDSGFSAYWKVLELNRNYPQQWVDDRYELENSSYGVSLRLPIETYQITERSMKYAVLFITLTFMVFFFVEVLRKLKVHPIQYGLVGLGLILFYLLLLSLSEQVSFGIAYLIGSVSIVTLITSYSMSIFKNPKLSAILALILILLYLFLYILIQLQDYALLIGSIVLFLILATVMHLSRKIDWYAIGKSKEDEVSEY